MTRAARSAAIAVLSAALFVPWSAATAATVPTCFGHAATMIGTDGPDHLTGTSNPDVIVGLGGNDLIDGGAGDDYLCGSANPVKHVFDGEEGIVKVAGEKLSGGAGDDHLDGGPGWDTIDGGDGNDVIRGGAGPNTLLGDGGDDVLYAGPKGDSMLAGDGTDVGFGGPGPDRWVDGTSHSGAEQDCVADHSPGEFHGRGGDDIVEITGAGDFVIFGGSGDDTISGGDGDDRLHGGTGDDTIAPDDGDDVVTGDEGVDTLDLSEDLHLFRLDPTFDTCGARSRLRDSVQVNLQRGWAEGVGTDSLTSIENSFAGQGDDVLIGSAGPNVFMGDLGRDDIRGLDGNDTLYGSRSYLRDTGDMVDDEGDRIDGGGGRDMIDGGAGADICTDLDGDRGKSCERAPAAARNNESSAALPWWAAVGAGAAGCAFLLVCSWLLSRRPWRRRPTEAQHR